MFKMRSIQRRPLRPLNLGRLMEWIKQGRIDDKQVITLKVLFDSGVAGKFKHGVKILADVCCFFWFNSCVMVAMPCSRLVRL